MFRILAVATAFACLATSASANLYACSLNEQGTRSGWIPEVVMIAFQESGDIFVSDPIGAAVTGKPAEASVLNESQKIIAIQWQIAGALSATSQYARFHYTATIDKQRNTVRMRAKPRGYANQFRGTGRCEVRPLPS